MMELLLVPLRRILYISMVALIYGSECSIGPHIKADEAATTYRMHHQLNMRGPHHPRSSEAIGAHHHHHKPHYQLQRSHDGSAPKLTQDTNLLRDEEHIREDLENLIPGEDTKNMPPEQLEFYYFKLHDFDNNTKLDGLEILQAIQHVMHSDFGPEHEAQDESHGPSESGGDESKDSVRQDIVEDEKLDDDFSYIVELIDKVLEEDDLDHDGFLSYIEYVKGRKKDQTKREKKEKRT